MHRYPCQSLAIAVAIAAALLLRATVASAAGPDGLLDASFGTGGKVEVDTTLSGAGHEDLANAVAVGPDGTVVVAGTLVVDSGDSDIEVVRLTRTGALDLSFGSLPGQSRVYFDAGGAGHKHDYGYDVAVGADGSVTVCGAAEISAAGQLALGVGRLTAAGVLDSTFGGGTGREWLPIGAEDLAGCSVALLPDGHIMLSFHTGGGPTGFYLLNPGGDVDLGFGDEGRIDYPCADLGGTLCEIVELTVSPRGTVYYAGRIDTRIADGAVGTNGSYSAGAFDYDSSNERVFGIGVQPDGRPLIAFVTGTNAVRVARLSAIALSRDTSFGSGGWAIADLTSGAIDSQFPGAMLVQPDGRIVVLGTVTDSAVTTQDCAIVRLRADGTVLDSTFGSAGRTVVSYNPGGTPDACGAGALAGDRVVLAGSAQGPSSRDLTVTRLTSGLLFTNGFESGNLGFWDPLGPR